MWEQVKTIAVTAFVTVLCSVAFWMAVLQRKWQRQDDKKKDERETSAAQISDRQILSSELWKRIEKLEQAESEMVAERIRLSEQISDLKADKKALTQLSVEQDEEIIVLKARNESLTLQLEECRKTSLHTLMRDE